MKIFLSLFIVAILATACAPSRKNPELMPVLAPPPSSGVNPAENPGSLFDSAQNDTLFADNRARKVGDIVMVMVEETSKAKHKADTDATRESGIEIGVDAYFDHNSVSATPFGIPNLGLGGPIGNPMVKASTSTGTSAKGETKRESELTAVVGARVVRLLPSGIMQVEGARELRINDETQILVVRGLVRPQDIGPDNSISSNYLADAKIEYYGEGILADKNKAGWLTRILDNIWPF